MTRRWMILGIALAATVAAALYEPAEPASEAGDDTSGEAATAPVAGRSAAARSPVETFELPARRLEPRPVANLFPAGGWQPPPPPAVAATPKAPPLPFRYLGRLQEGTQTVVFLGLGPLTHLVHEGETVAEYRAEAIGPRGMTLVYLPLNEKQLLTFGSQN